LKAAPLLLAASAHDFRPLYGVACYRRVRASMVRPIGHQSIGQEDVPRTKDVPQSADRYEPRVKKRRRNHCGWLTKPRAEMKRKMAKGVTKK